MIGENISRTCPPSSPTIPPRTRAAIRLHSNETSKYRDSNINVGGPIKKDKVWWYFSYRNQKTSVGQPNFIGPIAGTNFDTKLWNPSGKATYQMNQNNKLIGYYQWGQKEQPNRLPQSALNYQSLDGTLKQISGSWIYKGEWNGTINKNMYVEARYGVFGYYFPLLANSDTTGTRCSTTAHAAARRRPEGADRPAAPAGDRFGDLLQGRLGRLAQLQGWRRDAARDRLVRLPAGRLGQHPRDDRQQRRHVTGAALRADGDRGRQPRRRSERQPAQHREGEHDRLFITDQWPYGRATFNLGVRYDHYDVFTPDQTQLAYTFPSGARASRPLEVLRDALRQVELVRAAPRHDLRPAGHRQDRAEGQLRHVPLQPGRRRRGEREPEPVDQEHHLPWTDNKVCATCIPGDESTRRARRARLDRAARSRATISVDPNIQQPYSHQATVYLEQQLTEGVGARVGFVYYTVKNQTGTFQPNRPASAYTVPFNVVDRVRTDPGNADDQNLTVVRHPVRPSAASFPTTRSCRTAGQRRVQDDRVLAEQAPEPQLLAWRRIRLHLAARLPVRLSEHAERPVRLRLLDATAARRTAPYTREVGHPLERRSTVIRRARTTRAVSRCRRRRPARARSVRPQAARAAWRRAA